MQAQQWGRAREIYRGMVRQGVGQLVDRATYSDILFRLITVEEKLGNLDEAFSLLETFLQNGVPEHFYRPAMFTLARVLLRQGHPFEAQQAIAELERRLPRSEWNPDERAFSLSLKMTLHQSYSQLVERANRALEAGSYPEAISLYKKALAGIESGDYEIEDQEPLFKEKIRLHLAESYYQAGEYQAVVDLLASEDEKEPDLLFLLALSYQKLGEQERSLALFQELFSKKVENWEEIAWEYGTTLFEKGELEAADQTFQQLASQGKRGARLTHLAQLYRARIQLKRGEIEALPTTLHMISALLPTDDPLQYEIAYLRGEAALHSKEYLLAARLFEESLPHRNREKAEWFPSALYNIGWSYLMVGSDSKRETSSRTAFLYKAEQAFKQGIHYNRDERATLALGRTYLAQAEVERSREGLKRAELLLSQPHHFTTLEGRAEALLLRTRAVEEFAVRERLYRELTDPIYQTTPSYAEGWYCRGLNLFEQGEKLRKQSELQTAIPIYQSAARSLLQAFELLKESHPGEAANALRYTAQAYYNQASLESRKLAYRLLDTLFEQESFLLSQMAHPDEALYLRGLVSSVLMSETGEEGYLASAESALVQLARDFPDSRFAASALHILGTIRFHEGEYRTAEALFVELATRYPDSPYAGDSWFWAGESANWQKKEASLVRNYRQQVYNHYPNSHFAPEAYFNSYSFTEYLHGSPEAMVHLDSMEERYPSSPYLIVAQYLIGLDRKQERRSTQSRDPMGALSAFESASALFEKCQKEGMITPANLDYFVNIYYRSRLEGAATKLALAKEFQGARREEMMGAAEREMKELIAELSDEHHKLARTLTCGESYPRPLEEAQFGLIQTYLEGKNDVAAEALLRKMVARYKQCQISRGYYPSRVHFEMGRIAMRRGEYSLALEELNVAEEAAIQGVLSRDERLELWIQQALCLRARGELDEAMLTLSKVINDDSPSALRLEAMYLRAEVYELQGRNELAIKQLEATSRKGGRWATKANEKLRRDYGFN